MVVDIAQEVNEEEINVEKETMEAPLVVYKTPTWGELFKKTINNFVNYFSKIFTKENGQANQNNTD